MHLPGIARQEFLHPGRPFDGDDALLLEQFRKSDRLEIICAGGPVSVQMIQDQAARVVNI